MKRMYIMPAVKYSIMDTEDNCLATVSLEVTDENVDDSGKVKGFEGDSYTWRSSVWDD